MGRGETAADGALGEFWKAPATRTEAESSKSLALKDEASLVEV